MLVEPNFSLVEVDLNHETDKYLEYLLNRIGINESYIVGYKPEYLDKLVTRAVKRIKPFSQKGEEFRDAILWLSLLDIAQEYCGGSMVFISNDVRAFGRQALHPTLVEESHNRNIQISYYNDIKTFIEQHASRMEFVNKKWLLETINFEQFDDQIEEYIVEQLEDSRGLSAYRSRWREREDLEFAGYVDRAADIDDETIYDFYVYEKSDGTVYVESTYYVEYEVEFIAPEIVKTRPSFSRLAYHDFDMGFEDEIQFKPVIRWVEIEIVFGITLRDREVIQIELVDVTA
jgi:hypothetical protein